MIMLPIDIIEIELDARRLRAEEIRRMHGLVGKYLSVYSRLLEVTLLAGLAYIGASARHMLSRHPKVRHSV
jgi:hypothetical protein